MKRKLEFSASVGFILFIIANAINALGQSGLCGADVPFYYVNLNGNPDSVYISPQDVRRDTCCGVVFPDRCIEFEIILDTGAIGIKFDIYSGAEPPGALYYQINCGTLNPVGSIICLSGQGPHALTFCKPGSNTNRYAITSIPGITLLPDKYTTEGCSATLEVYGLVDSTITWMDITSGTGYYHDFLSCTTGCSIADFSTQPGFPPFIDFQVCGIIYSSQCTTIQNYICDTLRLFINPYSRVSITHAPVPICSNDTSRLLTAEVLGPIDHIRYLWFDAHDGGGNIIGNDSFFLAVSPGEYSVIIYDTLFPACSRDTASISVYFNLLPSIIISGIDTICEGEAAALDVTGADGYLWMPSSSLSCDTCASVSAFPLVTTLYHVEVADSNGCTAVDSFLLSVMPIRVTNISAVICEGDSFFAGGAFQFASGLYYDSLMTIYGCDSIIAVNLTVHPVFNVTVDINICEGETYFADGAEQTVSGTYFDMFITANGCDSSVITNLIVWSCDDGNACTLDGCVAGICVFTSINCDDGNPCTIDQCVNGICRHSNAVITSENSEIAWWKENCCCR